MATKKSPPTAPYAAHGGGMGKVRRGELQKEEQPTRGPKPEKTDWDLNHDRLSRGK